MDEILDYLETLLVEKKIHSSICSVPRRIKSFFEINRNPHFDIMLEIKDREFSDFKAIEVTKSESRFWSTYCFSNLVRMLIPIRRCKSTKGTPHKFGKYGLYLHCIEYVNVSTIPCMRQVDDFMNESRSARSINIAPKIDLYFVSTISIRNSVRSFNSVKDILRNCDLYTQNASDAEPASKDTQPDGYVK
jgi:hypothetical protein